MADSNSIDDLHAKLEEIGKRVKQARAHPGLGAEHDRKGGELEAEAEELRRRVAAAKAEGWDEVKRELHEDMEGLRDSAENWLAMIDDSYRRT